MSRCGPPADSRGPGRPAVTAPGAPAPPAPTGRPGSPAPPPPAPEAAGAPWVEIDGSMGEGGGQVLRTSLALSLCLGRPFRIHRLRARRPRPGLRPQHLAAVRAAAAVGRAQVRGDEIGSRALSFAPGRPQAGDYAFDIGTAGSACLVLQTLLPALVRAPEPSTLEITGGTHVPMAPVWEFIEFVYLPLVAAMGPRFDARLLRPGYYPHGGGRLRCRIEPVPALCPLHLPARGPLLGLDAAVRISRLPRHVAGRERAVLRRRLGIAERDVTVIEDREAAGPGNAVWVRVRCRELTELFSAIGQRGRPAEDVAGACARAVRDYLDSGVPVGPHLADQLLLPLALAGGGSFVTGPPSRHARTNMAVIEAFTGPLFRTRELGSGRWEVTVGGSD